jgi:ABC-2 type transport system permease protein
VVRILIGMRGAALANVRHGKFGITSLIVASLLGLVAAGATLLLGFTAGGSAQGGADQLSLVVLTWAAGRVGFAAFSGGDPAIPLDMFRGLPLSPRVLARALLVVGLADPALFFMAIAYGSIFAFGFRHGPIAGAVGIVGAAALLGLVSVLSTIVAAIVPSGSRRRQDAGTLIAAGLISAVIVTGTLAPALMASIASGHAVALSIVLRVLPTGWATDAVAGAASGSPVVAVVLVVALLGLIAVLVAWWPRVLSERLVSVGGSGHRNGARTHRRILPSTPVGAVASRELRLWIRDPTRAGFLMIAFVVGIGVCVVPLISASTSVLLPFAGLGTAVIAAAIAGNSYGFDGPALGLVLTTPGAERADVRGRQWAWILLVGPYAVLLSLAGLLVSGELGSWPWVIGLLPAALGGATGAFMLVSVLAPQPLDDNGGPTPTWTVKAYVTIFATAITTCPTLACLIVGAATGTAWLSWLGVPVGIATGLVCAIVLGRVAGSRLARRGPETFAVLAAATANRR